MHGRMRSTAIGALLALGVGACEPQPPAADTGPRGSFEPADSSAEGEADASGQAPVGETSDAEPGPAESGGEVVAEGGEEAGDGEPRAPEGYGDVVFTQAIPTEEELTLHSLAGYEVVAVYAEPKMTAKKIGFLRYGQRKRVTEKVGTGECKKGWYGLEGGGFACASKGLVVEKKPPYMKYAPPPPRLEQAFPYDWAYVRKWNTPMWWRVPTAQELTIMKERRAVLEAEREGKPPPGEEPAPPKPGGDPAPAPAGDGGADLPTVDEDPKPVEGDPKPEPAPAPPEPSPAEGGEQATPEPEPEPVKLPLNPQHPWLEKGFFISLAGNVRDAGKSYWRTARGAFVQQSETFKYEAKDYQGHELNDEVSFPVGFAAKKEIKVFELGDDDKLKLTGKVERRTFFDFEEEVEHGGKSYMRAKDGRLVRKEDVKMPQLASLPKGLDPWDRWIDVSLSQQMLVAYEGTRPVYVTLVSTGKKGSEEEPFETPTGRWRVYSKQVTSNMDGTTATDGNYAIQDVPWVMYFEGSYALHGAFWHRSFGRVRSHGCVNLGPSDARWLFFWTTPFLPEGWHGVHATDESPGTTVVVHE